MTAFAERGYAAARVDDIARAAGTSHGTFYLYFANKHAVLVALVERFGNEVVALADALADSEQALDTDGLREWLDSLVRVYELNWPVVCACASGTLGDDINELTESIRDRFARAVARRIAVANPSMDALTAGRALLTLVERFLYDALRHGDESSDRPLATLAQVLHTGFFGGSST